MQKITSHRLFLASGAFVWALGVGIGLVILADYAAAPAAPGAVPSRWPSDSRLAEADGRPHLVVALHPHCPCSRATVRELALVMARAGDRLAAHALLVQPDGAAEGWTDTDLSRAAAAIPGVTIVRDGGATEAKRFGALTSGETMLYDRDGRLLFHGGITPARGHSGSNRGRSAILRLVAGARDVEAETPVFGCHLHDETTCSRGAPCKS